MCVGVVVLCCVVHCCCVMCCCVVVFCVVLFWFGVFVVYRSGVLCLVCVVLMFGVCGAV